MALRKPYPPEDPCFLHPQFALDVATIRPVPIPDERRFDDLPRVRPRLARVPQKRMDEQDYPRARNPFILYRSDRLYLEEVEMERRGIVIKKRKGAKPQACVSKDVSGDWHNETPAVREYYQYLGEVEKIEHRYLYPDYKYKPKTKEQKEKLAREKAMAKKGRKSSGSTGSPPRHMHSPYASTSTSHPRLSPPPSSIVPPQLPHANQTVSLHIICYSNII